MWYDLIWHGATWHGRDQTWWTCRQIRTLLDSCWTFSDVLVIAITFVTARNTGWTDSQLRTSIRRPRKCYLYFSDCISLFDPANKIAIFRRFSGRIAVGNGFIDAIAFVSSRCTGWTVDLILRSRLSCTIWLRNGVRGWECVPIDQRVARLRFPTTPKNVISLAGS